jgi:hypothetical protein
MPVPPELRREAHRSHLPIGSVERARTAALPALGVGIALCAFWVVWWHTNPDIKRYTTNERYYAVPGVFLSAPVLLKALWCSTVPLRITVTTQSIVIRSLRTTTIPAEQVASAGLDEGGLILRSRFSVKLLDGTRRSWTGPFPQRSRKP